MNEELVRQILTDLHNLRAQLHNSREAVPLNVAYGIGDEIMRIERLIYDSTEKERSAPGAPK